MNEIQFDDTGKAFLPAAAFGNEAELFLCAAFDGVETVRHEGKLYLPADWLAREFPDRVPPPVKVLHR